MLHDLLCRKTHRPACIESQLLQVLILRICKQNILLRNLCCNLPWLLPHAKVLQRKIYLSFWVAFPDHPASKTFITNGIKLLWKPVSPTARRINEFSNKFGILISLQHVSSPKQYNYYIALNTKVQVNIYYSWCDLLDSNQRPIA